MCVFVCFFTKYDSQTSVTPARTHTSAHTHTHPRGGQVRLSDNRLKLTASVPLGLAAPRWTQQTDTELISDQPSGRLHRGGVITRRRPPQVSLSSTTVCVEIQNGVWVPFLSLSL